MGDAPPTSATYLGPMDPKILGCKLYGKYNSMCETHCQGTCFNQCSVVFSDLMDRLVDEAEGLAVDSSSSVCSGAGGGGRLETTTDQLSLLNSITASDLTGQSWDKLQKLGRLETIVLIFLLCQISFLRSQCVSCQKSSTSWVLIECPVSFQLWVTV